MINTTNCAKFIHAAPRSPPAVKYVVVTSPPSSNPGTRGNPTTTSSTTESAISWPARMAGAAIHNSAVITPRTAVPYRCSRKSPTV